MGEHEHHAPRICTVGIGRVERKPDVARATFVVEAARETAAEARRVAATAAESVIAALLASGISEHDARTAGIEVNPAWDHRDGRSVRVGFNVVNRIGVVIRDLDTVGHVIDAALGAGATGLDGVAFGLADATPVAVEARRLAVLDARARATTIAEAAGGHLGRLTEVVEGEPGEGAPRPMARAMMAAAADPGTPVLPGRVEVTVAVTATWDLD